MYVFVFFSSALVIGTNALAIPQYNDIHHESVHEKPPPIPILKQSYDQKQGGYQFSFETGNGILAKESGYIKNKGDKNHETLVQQGTITYHDEHGHPITLTYIADENGFQPQGAHLPTPPPAPHDFKHLVKSTIAYRQPEEYHHQQQQHQQEQYQHQEEYAQPQIQEEYEHSHHEYDPY